MTLTSPDPMSTMQPKEETQPSFIQTHKWEIILFLVILGFAIFSRLYMLGERVMSHDETSHVYFSWLLEQGRGYQHDPITHGPLQFHLLALSYFLIGDSDFSARLPAALLSIATIAFMWNYRRFLGKAGAYIAAFLLLISPYILYYGRYARNEAFIGFFAVLLWWSLLNYLQDPQPKYLIYVTLATVLHFTSKETAFIYTAQALLFLAIYLANSIYKKSWHFKSYRTLFYSALVISVILLIIGIGLIGVLNITNPITNPETNGSQTQSPISALNVGTVIAGIGVLGFLFAIYLVLRGYGWNKLKDEPSFDLAIMIGTFVLPMLAPFPVKIFGHNPIDYSTTGSIVFTAIFVALLSILAIAIGILWKPKIWIINFAFFYSVFIIFYTTVFTNGFGVFTGLVGALGYWLEQQGVNRGSQPWYFYTLVQIPIYEYLPALGVPFAVIYYAIKNRKISITDGNPLESLKQDEQINTIITNKKISSWSDSDHLVFWFFLFWSTTSLVAFSIAGEKMPWLTFHIALPMIILTAWAVGKLIDSIDIHQLIYGKDKYFLISITVFLISFLMSFYLLLGNKPPFQGKELPQLQATTSFLSALTIAIGSGWYCSYLAKNWTISKSIHLMSLVLFLILAIFTLHTSVQAAFVNYDNATEFLVYAHSARGPKDVLAQIEEISRRTTGGLGIKVAYDNETTYPFWWYLRNYPNQVYYEQNPTRELRDAPIILVGEENYGKLEPVVGQAYYQFDYIRLWWPNQDYFDLTWQRISDAFRNSQMRQALWNIWLYRDYTLYGQLTNKDMGLTNWYPSSRMRMYIRKDVVSQLWNYGSTPTEANIPADPYEGKQIKIEADKILGSPGTEPGQFQHPRDIAVASDGTLYIVDTDNNRIQHLTPDGQVIDIWGSFGDSTTTETPGGTFYQPWGIALDHKGNVYVADTWNHRIQKFTSDGKFIKMWGYFGQGETTSAFWGPRDIAIDQINRLFITDTGNKRIVVFDADGNSLTSFGEAGMQPGQFDEPVGLAFSGNGSLYVADTWNQRIQEFSIDENLNFTYIKNWEIFGWYGQSLDNKPYLTIDQKGNLFVTDPEAYRILEFDAEGNFIGYFGDFSQGADGFNLPASAAVDPNGGIWVTDAGNGRIMHFSLP